MRIQITLQAEDRGKIVDLLKQITNSVDIPTHYGQKVKADSEVLGKWGYSWEVVPDQHDKE